MRGAVYNRPGYVRRTNLIAIREPACHSAARMGADIVASLPVGQVHGDNHIRSRPHFEVQWIRDHQRSIGNSHGAISRESDRLNRIRLDLAEAERSITTRIRNSHSRDIEPVGPVFIGDADADLISPQRHCKRLPNRGVCKYQPTLVLRWRSVFERCKEAR